MPTTNFLPLEEEGDLFYSGMAALPIGLPGEEVTATITVGGFHSHSGEECLPLTWDSYSSTIFWGRTLPLPLHSLILILHLGLSQEGPCSPLLIHLSHHSHFYLGFLCHGFTSGFLDTWKGRTVY